MNEHVLVVEDEQVLRSSLEVRLCAEGYVVDTAADGNEGLEKATELPFDLVILDLMLPFRSGLDVCRGIRQKGLATPILMLTVRDQTMDKVVGLNIGADEYMTKPFEAPELIARIQNLLRRRPVHSRQGVHQFGTIGVHQFGTILVDIQQEQVTRNGKPVELTASEFRLLWYLMERAGSTVSRSELLETVWGYEDGTFSRTVDAHVASLRRKLEYNPKRPELILTTPGVGYKIVKPRKK